MPERLSGPQRADTPLGLLQASEHGGTDNSNVGLEDELSRGTFAALVGVGAGLAEQPRVDHLLRPCGGASCVAGQKSAGGSSSACGGRPRCTAAERLNSAISAGRDGSRWTSRNSNRTPWAGASIPCALHTRRLTPCHETCPKSPMAPTSAQEAQMRTTPCVYTAWLKERMRPGNALCLTICDISYSSQKYCSF